MRKPLLAILILLISPLFVWIGPTASGQNPPPPTSPPTSPPTAPPTTPPTAPPTQTGDPKEAGDPPETEQDPETQTEDDQQDEDAKPTDTPPESGDDVGAQLAESDDSDEAADEQDDQAAAADAPPETIEEVIKEEEKESGDSVGGALAESKDIRAGIWEHGPVSELYRLWEPIHDRLEQDTGIQVGLAYTTLLQVATAGDRQKDAWSGDIDFFGKWTMANRAEKNTGSLGFLVEQRHRFTDITPNDLNESLGALWKTTKGFNQQDWALAQAWWEQYLFDDHLKLVVGKIDASNFYNGNRFQSQNTSFLNQAFSSNPARAFPDNGLGVNVRLAPSDQMYFSLGAHDTNNTKTTSGFSDLDKDDLFYAAEFGFTPRFEGMGPGRYRFTAWYTGAGERTDGESGNGFAVSLEQDLGNDLIPFFRYGYQDDKLVDTKQIVVGGFGLRNPFGRERDIFGIGGAWGEPSDSTLRDQYVAELFYRLQLTPKVQLTSGFQVIFDPSDNPDEDTIGVFEFRTRVVF